MVVFNHCAGTMFSADLHRNLYIELVAGFREAYLDRLCVDKFLCLCNRLLIEIMQNFQTIR